MNKAFIICIISMTINILCLKVHANDVNIALNKVVTTRINNSSGAYSNNEYAYRITDGDLTTYWEGTNNYKISVMMDLGDIYTVTKMVIKWADGAACVSCDINYGETENAMSRVFSQNNLTETLESVHEITGNARYVELVMRGRVDGKNYKIKEIEIYSNYVPHENTEEEQATIDTVTQRLIATNISSGLDDVSASTYSDNMSMDGSWSDINYDDKISADGWEPSTHLSRLKIMAISFRNPNSSLFENEELLNKIELGLLYYKTKSPTCTDNWWYDAIGGPQVYMVPLLLIKGYTPGDTSQILSSYLKDQVNNYLGGGQNLSWIAEIAEYKGCVEDNYSITKHAFEGMASNLVIVSTQGNEGIKIDGSFHQHHAQLYSGGYGKSTAEDISEFMELSQGTLFNDMFDSEKKEIYKKLLLDGQLLLGYRKVMDFGTVGRNISRTSYSSSRTMVSDDLLNRAIISDPDNTLLYQAWLNHINNNAAFPLPGVNKHFWKSDIMTQHGENYYMSAKIISARTYGTECLNNENLKGYNLPLGATNIMTSSSEYKGIFPVWDWTKVPGTTAIQNQDSTSLSNYLIGTNLFGGGVSTGSDGIMAYNHNYRGLQAKKAYFFIDNMMFCMGSGISFTGNEAVATSVNQSFLSGDVTINNGTTQRMDSQTSITLENLKWIYHNNIGYIFPATENITVQNITQSGTWYSINALSGTSTVNQSNIFSAWINHGVAPSNTDYQYIVVPDKSLIEFEKIADNHGFVVVENSTSVQAVRKGTKYGVVFYQAGNVTMDDGLKISSDKAALIFIEVNGTVYDISVADPTYSETEIKLTINKNLVSAIKSNEDTSITFTLPSGDYTGSSVIKTYLAQSTVGISKNTISNNLSNLCPNPAQNNTIISFSSGRFTKFELINLTGKVMQQELISDMTNELNINLVNYSSGTYIIKLSGEKNIEIHKLIIIR